MANAYERGDYTGVLAIAQTLLSQEPNFDAHYWSAKAFASLGQYYTAENRLESALALNARSARSYYLLAHIKESQNEIEQAKSLLNKAIVLDENFIPAYLELSELYEEEDQSKHQYMREQALGLLRKLPPEHYLEDFASHVHELIQQLD
jgi:chemotaxis protein methyltransferase CheR